MKKLFILFATLGFAMSYAIVQKPITQATKKEEH